MSRSRKPKRSALKSPAADAPAADESTRESNLDPLPPAWVRNLLTIVALVHLFAVAISFSGVVEPSETHSLLLRLLDPYLRATHFGADDRPVYLAHGGPLEQPHRLQISRRGDIAKWHTIEPEGFPGLARSDRYARWISTIVSLAENDQPGLVAVLLSPEIRRINQSDPEHPTEQVRIIRLPTELTTVVDDAAPPPYVARVLSRKDRVDFIRINEDRLNAKAGPSAPSRTAPSGGDVDE